MSTYPRHERIGRPGEKRQIFAHRVTRLLFKSCAVQRIGHHAALLVVHIAHTEDAARYSGPITFWNSQLMETLGFSSPKQLDNARDKAVAAGWLHYHRDGTRTVGNYWVTIPANVAILPDTPIEEPQEILSPLGTNPGMNDASILSPLGMNCGTNPGMNCGKLPIPIPFPLPEESAHAPKPAEPKTRKPRAPRAPFVPPTLEQVAEFCREQKLTVNPAQFHDHYTANGWRVGGKSPMVDWQAAVRNWGRREFNTPSAPPPRKSAELSLLTPPTRRD